MHKIAKIKTPLQAHQEAAIKRGVADNIIMAHGMGTGKTLTSIALADAINKPTVALVPAPLVGNYEKEIAKHKVGGNKIQVKSLPTAVSQDWKIPKGSTVIIDEAHSLRNAQTQRLKYLKGQRDKIGRLIALTGTPSYNSIGDYATLANLVSGEQLLPEKDTDFKNKYIDSVKQPVGLIGWLKGVKPGTVDKLKNVKELKSKLSPYVDLFDADIEKPARIDKDVFVPMTEKQQKMYDFVISGLPGDLRYKIENNLPPTKSEAKQLNSFLVGSRQVANTMADFHVDENVGLENSAKLSKVVKDIKEGLKNNKAFKAFVYSNFLSSGIEPLGKLLDREKIPYRNFTGSLSKTEKDAIVADYNSNKLPVILGSGASTEGLDLKGTRMVGIVEPHFNNSKIEQAIARGIRYKSHEHLPEDQRNVTVNRYYSTFKDNRNFLEKMLNIKQEETVDQYLRSRALEKDNLMKQLRDVLTNSNK